MCLRLTLNLRLTMRLTPDEMKDCDRLQLRYRSEMFKRGLWTPVVLLADLEYYQELKQRIAALETPTTPTNGNT
jgi:hypothetical protein